MRVNVGKTLPVISVRETAPQARRRERSRGIPKILGLVDHLTPQLAPIELAF